MHTPPITATLTILRSSLRGENNLYLEAFSQELGLIAVMKRISAKKTSILPDTFDDISATLKPSESEGLKFLGEFEILKRRLAIANRYDAFEDAASIANIVLRNGKHFEDTQSASNALRRSLDAIESGLNSTIVLIKFLYVSVKREGYPIKEDFFAKLSDVEQRLFATIITTPTKDLIDIVPHARTMLEKLELWIKTSTDFEQ